MNKSILIFAAFSMATAIILGALGAHALKEVLDEPTLNSFKTGVHYQALQTLGIFIVQVIPQNYLSAKAKRNISRLFIVGIFTFCLSIYLLSFSEQLTLGGFTAILGPITPLGGLCFIAGWIYLGVAFIRKDSVKSTL